MSSKIISLKKQALLIAAAIGLAACGDQQPANPAASTPAAVSTPAAPASASEASAASAAGASEAAGTTLSSKDNKVQFVIPQNISGAFEDKLADGNLLPEGVPAEQVTLLQHNDDADLTLSVVQTGKTDKAADKQAALIRDWIHDDSHKNDDGDLWRHLWRGNENILAANIAAALATHAPLLQPLLEHGETLK